MISCQELPIPDLNPDTPEGGNVLIYNIGEVIPYTSSIIFSPFPTSCDLGNADVSIDLFGDGSIDLRIFTGVPSSPIPAIYDGEGTYWLIQYAGEIGLAGDYGNYAGLPLLTKFLGQNQLAGSSFYGIWSNPNTPQIINRCTMGATTIFTTRPLFPVGLSYIPVRRNIGGQYYYGWIEVFASDYSDNDTDDFLLISRFGISDTPGLRIGMGQE